MRADISKFKAGAELEGVNGESFDWGFNWQGAWLGKVEVKGRRGNYKLRENQSKENKVVVCNDFKNCQRN